MKDSRRQTRILIAATQSIFRARLRSTLESNFAIVGEASNAAQALTLTRQVAPDVLLFDISLRQSGVDVLRDISTLDQTVRVILLTRAVKRSEILHALQLDARGVLRKNSAASVLLKSIQCVMNGDFWIIDHAFRWEDQPEL